MMYLGQDAIGINHMLPVIGEAAFVESGTYTSQTDVSSSSVNIPHSLGVVPDFIIAIADSFSAETNQVENYIAYGIWLKSNLIASNKTAEGQEYDMTNNPQSVNQIGHNWPENNDKFGTITTFKIPYYNSGWKLKGGITYRYVIGKFKEQEVTAND